MTDTTDLDFLDAISTSSETPSPTASWEPLTRPTEIEPQRVMMSRVLQLLPAAKRPPEKLACATCPAAVWMSGASTTLQAYCMVTRLMAWTREEPLEITDCDGREQAIVAMQAQQAA